MREAQRKVEQETGMLHCTIKWAYEDGWTMREIGDAIGISQATVYRILASMERVA